MKERKCLKHGQGFALYLEVNLDINCPRELLDIYYNGLTVESRTYLDSCVGCVFRKRTPDEAEKLLAKISQNYDDWFIPDPTPISTPTPAPKKRGIIELNDESMREAKQSLKERGIKSEDVKNLPPIEVSHFPVLQLLRYTLSSSMKEIFLILRLLINA